MTFRGKDRADLMNDKHVKVGFYASSDKIVKDGNAGVARDYTFCIRPHVRYEAIFPARTVNALSFRQTRLT